MADMLNLTEVTMSKVYSMDLDLYKDMMENLRIPILLMDKEGNIIFANKAALLVTGYSSAELIDKKFNNIFNADVNDVVNLVNKTVSKRIDCQVKFKHEEDSILIPAQLKVYDMYAQDDRRSYFYQLILTDIHLGQESIKKVLSPLESLLKQLKEQNDELEYRFAAKQ